MLGHGQRFWLQFELQFRPWLRLLRLWWLLALYWSLISRRVCMLGGIQPPRVGPLGHFSFSLSLLLALCYPFHGLSNDIVDARPPHLVILAACFLLLLSLWHQWHHCKPLCLLAGCPGFHQVCKMSNFSVQLCQFLCVMSYRTLHAAAPVARRRRCLAPPSPFSVLVSLHRLKYCCSRSLCTD